MNVHPNLISAPTSSSSAQYLEQLNDQEFWQLAIDAARSSTPLQVPAHQYLMCALDHGRCLLPLISLREVVPSPDHFARFPTAPSWMCGVTAWRGEIITVIDLDTYLLQKTPGTASMKPPTVYSTNDTDIPLEGTRLLLIAQLDTLPLGFFVTAVESITSLDAEHAVSFERIATHHWLYLASGVTEHNQYEKEYAVLLLDMSTIFTDVIQSIKSETFL